MDIDSTYFRPRRLGHANIWVKDLGRSERFYNEICGLTIEFTEPSLVASFLGTGHTPHDLGMIETTGGKARYGRDGLLQIPEGIGLDSGLNHIAWELENEAELVAAYQRITANRIPFDQTVDHQVAHSIYMFDPDGNYIEFYCDTVKEWRTVLHGPLDLISGAWNPEAAQPFTDSRYDLDPEVRTVDQATVHPRRVTHVVLGSADLPRMLDFYTTVGGMRPVWSAADESIVCLRGSSQDYRYHLAIYRAPAPVYHHVAFELDSEAALLDALARLDARGIVPEKIIDHPSKRSFFLLDPDGLRSEFFTRRTADFVDLSDETAAARAYLI
ncbi:MAG TPA: VOC family protein [Candidatus Binataceae bacterium]|jgi:catechol 2,3-dioxygenase|nr:VOC family protein [Candidatus Binataceae bacterium]